MCLGHSRKDREDRRCRAELATVEISGVRRQVNVACIVDETHTREACVDDWVLVHVGFAMSRIDAPRRRRRCKS